jgi:hypothetical protein
MDPAGLEPRTYSEPLEQSVSAEWFIAVNKNSFAETAVLDFI